MNGISVDLIDAEPKCGGWIDQHYSEFLHLQKLIIFNGYTIDIEHWNGRLILVDDLLLQGWKFVQLWSVVGVLQFVALKIVGLGERCIGFVLANAGEYDR